MRGIISKLKIFSKLPDLLSRFASGGRYNKKKRQQLLRKQREAREAREARERSAQAGDGAAQKQKQEVGVSFIVLGKGSRVDDVLVYLKSAGLDLNSVLWYDYAEKKLLDYEAVTFSLEELCLDIQYLHLITKSNIKDHSHGICFQRAFCFFIIPCVLLDWKEGIALLLSEADEGTILDSYALPEDVSAQWLEWKSTAELVADERAIQIIRRNSPYNYVQTRSYSSSYSSCGLRSLSNGRFAYFGVNASTDYGVRSSSGTILDSYALPEDVSAQWLEWKSTAELVADKRAIQIICRNSPYNYVQTRSYSSSYSSCGLRSLSNGRFAYFGVNASTDYGVRSSTGFDVQLQYDQTGSNSPAYSVCGLGSFSGCGLAYSGVNAFTGYGVRFSSSSAVRLQYDHIGSNSLAYSGCGLRAFSSFGLASGVNASTAYGVRSSSGSAVQLQYDQIGRYSSAYARCGLAYSVYGVRCSSSGSAVQLQYDQIGRYSSAYARCGLAYSGVNASSGCRVRSCTSAVLLRSSALLRSAGTTADAAMCLSLVIGIISCCK
ncbi:uncharacterized protein LOC141720405 isoform X2 [Apium graveolens]|uniref:uncharacterized protein LOC141720405 isoform X2 n=1 Tax=Apium graveolens TaxID=4045 RepID=UPI003D7AF368